MCKFWKGTVFLAIAALVGLTATLIVDLKQRAMIEADAKAGLSILAEGQLEFAIMSGREEEYLDSLEIIASNHPGLWVIGDFVEKSKRIASHKKNAQ